MSEDVEHYPDFPLALLNTLTYFDFKLIERADLDRAIEKFEIRVKEMEHKEEKMLKEREKEDQAAFELKQVNWFALIWYSHGFKNQHFLSAKTPLLIIWWIYMKKCTKRIQMVKRWTW